MTAAAGPWIERWCELQASKDRLTVKYKSQFATHDDNFGTIQANFEVPKDRSVYYYEIKVNNVGEGTITVGYADRRCKPTKQMGYANFNAIETSMCKSP